MEKIKDGAKRARARPTGAETSEGEKEKTKSDETTKDVEGAAAAEEEQGATQGQTGAYTQVEGEVYTGIVKWFNVTKGYGFITPTDGCEGDVFVHQSNILMSGFRSLDDCEHVEYTFKISEQGREATAVTGPHGAECQGSKRRPRPKYRRRVNRCYNCDEVGHHAKDCPKPPMPKRCHHCKSEDHLVAECPEKQSSSQGNSKSESNGESPPRETKPDVT